MGMKFPVDSTPLNGLKQLELNRYTTTKMVRLLNMVVYIIIMPLPIREGYAPMVGMFLQMRSGTC